MNSEQLLARIEALENEIKLLKASTTIPFEIDRALRDRLNIDTRLSMIVSTKDASTETQSVNEAGTGTYSVAKPPVGFYLTELGTQIPYYNT